MFNKLNPFAKKNDELVEDAQIVANDAGSSDDTQPKKGMMGKLKDKAVEKMLEKQLAQVPPAQREMLMTAIKNNPDFFEKIANKIKAEQEKNGGNQMAASMKVMREHQGELMKIMQGK